MRVANLDPAAENFKYDVAFGASRFLHSRKLGKASDDSKFDCYSYRLKADEQEDESAYAD